jgi:hypothetical protein
VNAGDEAVAEAVGCSQRLTKSNSDYARKQTNQQCSRKLPSSLLVSAQEVAHFAPDDSRGGRIAGLRLPSNGSKHIRETFA